MTDSQAGSPYKKIVKSSRGMSIIGVLIAVAVLGIIAATLASVYEGMTRVMQRTSMQRETDDLQRFVQGVLSQPVLCENAFRDAVGVATGKITWNFLSSSEVLIPFIQLYNPASLAAPVSLASASTALNPDTGLPYNQVSTALFIDSIKLQARDTDGDNVPNAVTQTKVIDGATTYDAVPADLLISFRGPPTGAGGARQWSGGSFRPRRIPIVVMLVGNVIQKCDVIVGANRAMDCDEAQATVDQGGPCLPATCTSGPPLGTLITFLDGFDNNNQPKCNCRRVCRSPGAGPGSGSGTGPGPGAGGGN